MPSPSSSSSSSSSSHLLLLLLLLLLLPLRPRPPSSPSSSLPSISHKPLLLLLLFLLPVISQLQLPLLHSPSALSTALLPSKTISPNPPPSSFDRHPPAPQPTHPPALPLLPSNPHLLLKRWSGYTTMTVFVNTVTVNLGAPIATVTLDATDSNPAPATVTVTVGAYTQTISQPSPVQTVLVVGGAHPTTITTTSFITIPATSTVYYPSTPSPLPSSAPSPWFGGQPQSDGLPPDRPCYPGEENQRYPGHLQPTNPTQTSTLFTLALYFVIILVCWNLFLVRHILFPLKLIVVAWHELGHVIASACSGYKLESVTVDPNEGGATRLEGGNYNRAALPLGYITSCLFGGVLVFCGFNTLASKIASFFLMVSLVVTFWWATGLVARLMTLGCLGLLIGFWFIDHAGILRYYVLFMGVMSSWYVIYDVMDDLVFRKGNPCCAVIFELRYPMIRSGQWALMWTIYSAISFVAWILLALVVWRQTPRGMYCQSQQFLPT